MTTADLHPASAGAQPLAGRSALRNLGRRLLREPLAHFLAAGLVLFAAAEHHRRATDVYRIVVTPAEVGHLVQGYRLEFGTEPDPARVSQLIDKYVDEEVLYREGRMMKLDQDDEIVRRRIVQKMQFLQQDLAAPAGLVDAELVAYYQAHRGRYASPRRVSFSHIFFSDVAGGPEVARVRAAKVLPSLDASIVRAPDRGDAFPDLYDYAAFAPEQAARLFGESELSRALFTAPAGRWAGPFRSGYGWHLVRVGSVEPAGVAPFAAVRERVRADLLAEREAAANRKSFAALKARFTVVRPDEAGAR